MVAQLRGGAELMAFLDQLPKKLANNVLRGGARAGAKVLADEVSRRAQRLRTPDLKNGHHTTPGEPIADKVLISTRVRDGSITGKVYFKGFAASVGIWAEYGTLPHLISVREDVRPSRATRHGQQPWSIRLINKAVRSGSLVIGGHFVGASVHHPGATAHPFMRPALDTKAEDALRAMAAYVNTRLEQGGLNAPLLNVEEGEDQ